MIIREIDWRYPFIREILAAVTAGLEKIQTTVAPDDVMEALEQSESFLGLAFVAAQTYIAGIIGDANQIAKHNGKPSLQNLHKQYSDTVPGTSITKIHLCFAIANYFKHEWPHWLPPPKRVDESRRVLYAAGFSESGEFPCVATAQILLGSNPYDVSPLLPILFEWRKTSSPRATERRPTIRWTGAAGARKARMKDEG